MNRQRLIWNTGLVLAGGLLLWGTLSAPAKLIRLRAGFISITNNAFATESTTNTTAVSGLYLIQFTGPVQPEWRHQLAAEGVELLKYAPDDAFVAKLSGTRLSALGKLAFVRWAGEYRAEHKLHPKLKEAAQSRIATAPVDVNVIISPQATAQELGQVRRLFAASPQEFRRGSVFILRGQISPARMNALAGSGAVLWIEPAAKAKLSDESAAKIVGGAGGVHQTVTQALGYTGTNVIVAVMDSGLSGGSNSPVHPDLAGRVAGWLYYGGLADAADQYGHGTHVAGLVAGNGATGETDTNGALYGLSIAPGASVLVQRMFDENGNLASSDYGTVAAEATQAGAVIGSASWNIAPAAGETPGEYTGDAMSFDALVRDADPNTSGGQPYVLVFSAGNTGPDSQTIESPAVAKNVIAVGAAESSRTNFASYTDGPEEMADFSGRGPCADGRIKPDLVAPGTWVASLASTAAATNLGPAIDPFYFYLTGTSQAAPQVSGAAAVFFQYYRQTHTNAAPSPALVKAALINAAHPLAGADTAPVPNMDEGWGRVDVGTLLGPGRTFDFVDQPVLLTVGQSYSRPLIVNSSGKPLIVTMAYTDVPGLPGVTPSLVNDLDLKVVSPSGHVYRGNQFDDNGESVPDAAMTDSTNNVEQIYIAAPEPGEYVVQVVATAVNGDALNETPPVYQQDFALTISGDIPPAGQATLLLDRQLYTAPDQVQIKVIDPNRAGSPSVTVSTTSTTETNAVGAVLLAADAGGVFTGAVVTATGPVLADGRLYVSQGDLILVQYFDAAIGTNVSVSAAVNLVPPVLTNVVVTSSFGRMFVSWQSSEPASEVIYYGTNTSFGQTVTNSNLSLSQTLALTGLMPGQTYYFQVVATDQAGNTTTNNNGGVPYTFVAITPATVLLVDSYIPDIQSTTVPLSTYTNALNQTGVTYDVWPVLQFGSPTPDVLQPYQVVIWRVSDYFYAPLPYSTLTGDQQTMIQNYLNGGGSFMMASMQILKLLDNGPFRANVLQVAQYESNPEYLYQACGCDEGFGVPQIQGNGSDPVTSGVNMTLDYSVYPSITYNNNIVFGPDFSDTFTPAAGAEPIIYEPNSGKVCGIRYPRTGLPSAGRVVFLSFPLDAVPESGTAPNNRGEFLRSLLDFLAPGGNISLDAPAYPLPGVAVVEVDDPDSAGQGTVSVTATNLTTPNGVALELQETVRLGVFEGYFYLESATNPPAAGTLQAQDGDTIQVQYLDGLSQNLLTATATAIANPPAISNVIATADYENATVGWLTSEPADTLVQYGESVYFGGTAYKYQPTTNHLVALGNLLPGTTYYYRVISHDAAGNTAVDDNDGQLYTLTTLSPLQPPWSDNLEGAVTNWQVRSATNSQSGWTLGVPDNGRVTSAHSPTNAWGSNLGGAAINFADTSLISPAVQLDNGNVATLNFWQNYDFSETAGTVISQGGQLLVSTNSLASPVLLKTYTGAPAGWQSDQVDLTPYIGHVVKLIWRYQVSAVTAAARPGWLVDDVSITVSNLTAGAIQITNNLWQARFSLSGPVSLNGLGSSTLITNAPPGEYVLNYGSVPFYQTPLPQTNTLLPGATLTFPGNYSFADANSNGISDAWELYYFGTVDTNRTARTDTLGNGMTDYAKFIAGLDPTNPASLLQLTATTVSNGAAIQFNWDTTPDCAYRIVGRSAPADGIWSALTDWTQASSVTEICTVPNTNLFRFFRVQVQP